MSLNKKNQKKIEQEIAMRTHLDEIKALNEKIEKSNREIALLEARFNQLETKK